MTIEQGRELQRYFSKADDLPSQLIDLTQSMKKINKSQNKKKAMGIATAARTKNAKRKMNNAIQLMIFENKKLSQYLIAKEAKVSFITVRKYINHVTIEKLNNSKNKPKTLF